MKLKKPYSKIIAVSIASSLIALTVTGCADQQKVVKKEKPIQYSTFSGLRDYGSKDGYEILSPIKLNQCVELQENFAVQKSALKDLQTRINRELKAINEDSARLKQAKQNLAKYKTPNSVEQTPNLVEREKYDKYNQALQNFNDKIDALRTRVQGYNNMQADYRQKSVAYNQSVTKFNQACAIDKKLYLQDLEHIATGR